MKKKRKIIFLSSCVRGGGAGWSLFYLIKNLDRTRFLPVVVVPDPGIFGSRYRALGVRIVVAPQLPERSAQQHFRRVNFFTKTLSAVINLVGMIRTVFWLARFVKREQCELLYANNMLVKSVGAFAARRAGVPCVLHIRNLHEKRLEAFFYRRIFRMAAVKLIISNSAASAAPFMNDVPDKLRVVHNGIDLADYGGIPRGTLRRELGLRGKTIIGYTGNLIPRKGLDILIRAAAHVLGRGNAVLVIIGRVPIGSNIDHQAEYEELARECGIAGRVLFAGFRKDVRPYVRDMDVLVLPSRQEPFGRSIVEAMALGVPVVASRVGGIPEIITSGRDGFLVPVEDVAALARVLQRLVRDSALRRRIGGEGRAAIRRRFDVARLTKEIEELLDQLPANV